MWAVSWHVKNRLPRSWIDQAVSRFEKKYRTASKEISIAVVGDSLSRSLNKKYRGKDRPTNVLSFSGDSPDQLGEIVLCLPRIKKEAKQQGTELKHYFQYILIHGLLHLAGMDHVKDRDANKMERAEQNLLSAIKSPHKPKL